MAKIEVGRFSDLMRRLLSMKGVVEVAQELAPEISPVFVLEADRPEWAFIKNEKLCSSQISVTAVVGQPGTGRLRNPLGSGVIAIVSKFTLSADGGLNTILISRFETNANLASIVTTVTRDCRFAINSSAMIASQANVGIAIGADFFWHSFLRADEPWTVKLPFILMPGFAVDVTCESANRHLRADVHWLERRLGELEVVT